MQTDKLLRYHLRQIPLVRLYLFFLAGLIFRNSLANNYIIILPVVLAFLSYLLSKKINDSSYFMLNSLKGFSFSLLFLTVGFLAPWKFTTLQKTESAEINWKGVVLTDARVKENTSSYIVKARSLKDNSLKPYKIRLTLENKDTFALPGDSIIFTTRLKRICNRNNPAEFDYARYMQRKDIIYQSFVNKQDYEIEPVENIYNAKFIALRWRNHLLAHLNNYNFSEENHAVLAALTLGYKNLLPEEITTKFAHSGAMHILAVSGLHVGIIYMLFNFLLSLFPLKNREYRFVIIIVIIWLYALLTGLSTSVVRASLMFSFISIGKLLNRDVNIYNIIASAAFLLTAINPEIIFDVGFQLSFSAVTGIVFFQSYFQKLVTIKNKVLDYPFQLFTVSIAAQIVTLPFTLFYFQQFPVYFWLTNLIVIPLVFVIVLVFILFLISNPVQIMNLFIYKILNFLLTLLNYSITRIDKLPFSHLSNIDIDLLSTIIIVLIVITIGSLLFLFTYKKLVLVLILFTALFVNDSYEQIKVSRKEAIVVFNVSHNTLICCKSGYKASLFANSHLVKNKSVFSYTLNNYLTENRIKDTTLVILDINNDSKLLRYKNTNFLIFGNSFLPDSTLTNKTFYLLPAKQCIPDRNLHSTYNVKHIILTNELNYYRKNIWKLYANTYQIPVTDIAETGAYILSER